MEDEADSRTATFATLKRPNDEPSLSNRSNELETSTPRKRVRYSHENVLPTRGESQTSSDLSIHNKNGEEHEAIAANQSSTSRAIAQDAKSLGTRPATSWNSGSKTKIRASLAGRQKATNLSSAQKALTAFPSFPNKCTQESVLDASNNSASVDDTGGSFMLDKRHLYLGNLSYVATEAHIRDFLKDFDVDSVRIPTNPLTLRSVGYAFVVFSDPVETEKAIAELDGQEILQRKVSLQLARGPTKPNARAISGGVSGGRKAVSSRDSSSEASHGRASTRNASLEPNAGVVSGLASSTTHSLNFDRRRNGSENAPEGASIDSEKSSSRTHQRRETSVYSSSDEEAVILNPEGSSNESGEISDSDDQGTHKSTVSEQVYCDNSDSESQDEMMVYSNSEADRIAGSVPGQAQPTRPRILADLDPNDLKLQLRYFHITKGLKEVDHNIPVRCLTCASEGHMAAECEEPKCMVCYAPTDHSIRDCPKIQCTACFQPGHVELKCPFKTRASRYYATCSLCKRQGHVQGDCELLWRTSGRPWETDLTGKLVRLECYECGTPGHLGNDCPARLPGKPMGSSTWTSRPNRIPAKSKDEINIRGRAQQREPIIIHESDSDEDWGNFYGSKVPPPRQRAQIKIAGTAQRRLGNPQQTMPSARGSYERGSNEGPINYRSRDYDQHRPRPSERRSISPRPREFEYPNTDGPAGYWRDERDHDNQNRQSQRWPPLPREPLPLSRRVHQQSGQGRRGGEVYRPMPSAARQAWRQHRI